MDDRQRLNDAMRAWSNTLSQEDVEGDPWDIAHLAFLAGRDFGRSEAEQEVAALRAGALEMKCWGCSTFVYLAKPPEAPWCGQCAPIRAAIAKAQGEQHG